MRNLISNAVVLLTIICLPASFQAFGQVYQPFAISDTTLLYYPGGINYEVKPLQHSNMITKPRNVILLIGDGMGLSHVTAAMVANGGSLYMSQFRSIGFTTTFSANNFITDSGAGCTAIAAGIKTYNGAIGVDIDSLAVENMRELFQESGRSTGIISTSSITHATPAVFYAHQPNRKMYRSIAGDLVNSGTDLFMGGGLQYFINDTVSGNLIKELEEKGYLVDTQTVSHSPVIILDTVKSYTRFAGLYAAGHLASFESGRGDFLPVATKEAIKFLNRNQSGFFLMVEGSQIDWGGHDNNTGYIITETLDFDRAVGEALRFAAKDQKTLVIVTADHETGGFAVHDGNFETGYISGRFTSTNHTGALVPVFAFGPGSEMFSGFYDNTDIMGKILKLLEIPF